MGCDPLDPAQCLLPFPNDHFTVADPTTATGRRVSFSVAAMPRNGTDARRARSPARASPSTRPSGTATTGSRRAGRPDARPGPRPAPHVGHLGPRAQRGRPQRAGLVRPPRPARRHRRCLRAPTRRSCILDADDRRAPPVLVASSTPTRSTTDDRAAADPAAGGQLHRGPPLHRRPARPARRRRRGHPAGRGVRRLPRRHAPTGRPRAEPHRRGACFDDLDGGRRRPRRPLPRLGLHRRQRAQPHRARAAHPRRRLRRPRRRRPGRRRRRGRRAGFTDRHVAEDRGRRDRTDAPRRRAHAAGATRRRRRRGARTTSTGPAARAGGAGATELPSTRRSPGLARLDDALGSPDGLPRQNPVQPTVDVPFVCNLARWQRSATPSHADALRPRPARRPRRGQTAAAPRTCAAAASRRAPSTGGACRRRPRRTSPRSSPTSRTSPSLRRPRAAGLPELPRSSAGPSPTPTASSPTRRSRAPTARRCSRDRTTRSCLRRQQPGRHHGRRRSRRSRPDLTRGDARRARA